MKYTIGIILAVALMVFGTWYAKPQTVNNDIEKSKTDKTEVVEEKTKMVEEKTDPSTNPSVNSGPGGSGQAHSTGSGQATNEVIVNNMHTITIETNKGTIQFETYDADAPKTVDNFVTLAGKGFYDNVIFHRVIPGFMIQGGDPTGTGMGGPGYKFDDELDSSTPSAKEGYKQGVVAMANSGPNTQGSQFFIMHQDYPLPHSYTIFGKVVSGQDVVDAIANSPRNGSDKPDTDIVMEKVTAEKK